MKYQTVLVLVALSAINFVSCQTIAQATLQAGNINGTVVFAETPLGIHVTGTITGLPAGLYGFHVHEIGDVSTCDAAGAHFNPEGNTHGGRDHQVRHVGDLGNIEFAIREDGGVPVAHVNFVDNVIALNGTNSILGRTLVLHEQVDDLGLGGHETSNTTGNAGPRVACGIIRDVADSSVGFIAPSLTVFILTVVFMCISI